MVNEITKEEINALMSVQSKAVEQQIIIAERLKTIADNQEKTLARLQNGLSREISEKINLCTNEVREDVRGLSEGLTIVKKDTTWIKWLFGSVGLVVCLSMIYVNIYWLSHRASTAMAVTEAVEIMLQRRDNLEIGR